MYYVYLTADGVPAHVVVRVVFVINGDRFVEDVIF